MTNLRRNLGLIEAIGLSLSIIAPTMAMAFNVTLAVGAAGRLALSGRHDLIRRGVGEFLS